MKKGFTLLEILITIIIFSVGVIAVARLFSYGLVGSVDAENTTIAMNLSKRRLEEIKNLDFDTEIINEARADVSEFSEFQREVNVTEAETDLKEVVVTTYWTYKGNDISANIRTYVSKN